MDDGIDRSVLLNDGNGKFADEDARWTGSGKLPHVIEFAWEQPVEVGAARIISGRFNGSRVFDPPGDFAIEEHDGKIWRPILPAIKNNENPVWSTTFPPVKTKHIRLVITATPHNLSRVWEIEFYQPLTGIKK
jgi:hypothetical protein